ncbi:MAG TPA: hypothetical protein VKS81_08055 [Bacteroidota bacterium]|nr:hypothetical protein [Bacteroidota bacterium]
MKSIWKKAKDLVEQYPVIIAALVIYGYYLLTSLDLFHHHEKESFIDYLLRYDSLFFLWLAAASFLQLQRTRKASKQNADQQRDIERVMDRQIVHERFVKEITMMLQDSINNPLAVISVTSHEIRKRFEKDIEILHWIDRIESSIQRINNTIRDLQVYEANKMIEETANALKEKYEHHPK